MPRPQRDTGTAFLLEDDGICALLNSLCPSPLADADDTEHACGSFDLPVGKATRTHHFRVLREAGLIDQRFHGNGSGVPAAQ